MRLLQADFAAGWWVLQVQVQVQVQRCAELVATAALRTAQARQASLQVRQSCPAQPSPVASSPSTGLSLRAPCFAGDAAAEYQYDDERCCTSSQWLLHTL